MLADSSQSCVTQDFYSYLLFRKVFILDSIDSPIQDVIPIQGDSLKSA